MTVLRSRSVALTERFIELADRDLAPLGFEVVTPRSPADRGSHVSLRHAQAWAITQAAIAVGVIGDYREPGLCRFGFAPLHTTLEDVEEEAIERLVAVMQGETWRRFESGARPSVT